MHKLITVLGIIVVTTLVGLWYHMGAGSGAVPDAETQAPVFAAVYRCADEQKLIADFSDDTRTVVIELPFGEVYELHERAAATGVQYESDNGSVVGYIYGLELTLSVPGVFPEQTCVASEFE